MQKIKNLLGEIKNPKINQDVKDLLKEVNSITRKLQSDQAAIRRLEDENIRLNNDILLICEKLDVTSSDIKTFMEKAEDTKSAAIAITSWAIFFVAVSSAVYVIANNL